MIIIWKNGIQARKFQMVRIDISLNGKTIILIV
jgi:hypothetical protein